MIFYRRRHKKVKNMTQENITKDVVKPKSSKMAKASCYCSFFGLLLLAVQVVLLLIYNFDIDLLLPIYLLWHLTVFLCTMAIVTAILAVVIIKVKKAKVLWHKQVILSVCLLSLGFLPLRIIFFQWKAMDNIVSCTHNLRNISEVMHEYSIENNNRWPVGSEWCDILVDQDARMRDCLRCPGDKDGPSSYALNENATKTNHIDIPSNMVLLFESETGWNKVGGPEILTTKHHKGKGCCVLYGDGSSYFIETERLNTLRWKVEK